MGIVEFDPEQLTFRRQFLPELCVGNLYKVLIVSTTVFDTLLDICPCRQNNGTDLMVTGILHDIRHESIQCFIDPIVAVDQ